jgi:hypothetical protein
MVAQHSNSATGAEPCVALLNQHNDLLVRFLDEQVTARRSPCISSVIKRLGEAKDEKAITVLIRYLDYVDPATGPQPGGGADVRPHYPAVTALFQIGTPSAPQLLSAIEEGGSSKLQENATLAYMFVYRDDLASGIRLLKKEELTSQTADHLRRLKGALQMLINDCKGRSEKESEECKNAEGKG